MKMSRKEYDTLVLTDPALVPEEQEMELIVRDLTPGDRRYKYRSAYVTALVSKSEAKYPDRLWIRLGKGQLQEKPWSIKILKELNKFPKG
jgi:phenylphosphate carboxylase gamma subunit